MKNKIEILKEEITNLDIHKDKKDRINSLLTEIYDENIKKIEKSQNRIENSLNYAKTIQQALLTRQEYIDIYLYNYFILFKPKIKISGDFYYVNEIDKNLIVVVGDCTGHGVPGAFLTILAITYLHGILTRDKIENPGQVLNILRERFKRTFKPFGSDKINGLYIALCSINKKTNILQYAGANIPLFIIRNSEFIEYKPTRNPIGLYPKEVDFKNNQIQLEHNDLLYIFSDGFQDQLSEHNNEKFMKRNFKNLLLKIHKLPIKEQKNKLIEQFKKWKGANEQTDDILIIGIKFN